MHCCMLLSLFPPKLCSVLIFFLIYFRVCPSRTSKQPRLQVQQWPRLMPHCLEGRG